MENNKAKIIKCKHCPTILTDNNKIKGKNLCLECNKRICREYYVKNTQPQILEKINEKNQKPKRCNDCDTILNDDNKVKERNQCKECRSKKRKEYLEKKNRKTI
jgi:hypothetical protein